MALKFFKDSLETIALMASTCFRASRKQQFFVFFVFFYTVVGLVIVLKMFIHSISQLSQTIDHNSTDCAVVH